MYFSVCLENVESLKNVIVIGQPEQGLKNCIAIGDLLENDGKSAPRKVETDWDKQTIFILFTSTTNGSRGIEHTHKSLVSCFFSPEGAANHWFDQFMGEGLGNSQSYQFSQICLSFYFDFRFFFQFVEIGSFT